MHAYTFTDNPRSTLEAVRMLLFYFSDGGNGKPVIHFKAIRRASRLLKLMTKTDDEGNLFWVRAKEWKSRLVLSGLDPDTLEIVDQGRWDLAWQQMSRTRTFRDDIQRRDIAMGKIAPKAEPFIRSKILESKKRESPAVNSTVIDYLSPAKKAALLGRSKKR
jgi:hypothetical protein